MEEEQKKSERKNESNSPFLINLKKGKDAVKWSEEKEGTTISKNMLHIGHKKQLHNTFATVLF